MSKKSDLEKAQALLEEARDLVSTHAEAAQKRFDALSERAQDGERGQALQEEIDSLEAAADSISTALSDVEEATPQ